MIKARKQLDLSSINKNLKIKTDFSVDNQITLYNGDCLEFLKTISDKSIQLIVTSPPYNVGKSYEKKLRLNEYIF